MRLTVKSEYGVLALIDLATRSDGIPASAREVSERQAIPAKYLEQLFVALRRAGLVSAIRGAKGGFVLARDPADISVLSVVEALEGPLSPTVCEGERAHTCQRSGCCAASSVWERATEALRTVFAEASIGDLADRQLELDGADDPGATETS